MHPAIGVEHLLGVLLVVPVAEHHRIATRAQLTGLPALHRLSAVGVDNLDLDMRMRAPDCRGAPLQVIVEECLTGDRRGFCHAVCDGDPGHMHFIDAPLHHLDGAH
ncbi:Uncharacterised protein [Mycobacteroides abscessus subsp. abscessus]|nr:Uncharacterised protein [Mycobacteroides abscessus subsp. abscessus]